MAFPERKPIYETFEKIAKEIVEKHQIREYASSEIEALEKEIQTGLRSIREKLLMGKFSPLKK